jgi:sugar (pentulose or hexulose) kinase
MNDLILAIDVGTTVAKAVVFDAGGAILGLARQPTPLSSPRPGWNEMDMDRLWDVVCAVSRAAVADVRGGVGAISLSGISCGAWLIDADGRPLRPAILWNDGRCAETNAAWQRSGRLSEIFALSGSVLYPGFTLPLLAWLDREEGEMLAAARTVLCCKDWLRFRMTGIIGTDETDASYMPCDVAGRRHSAELMRLCGVERRIGLLPPIARSDTIAGTLTREAAAAMGLAAGLPVAYGMTDLTAATVGAGAVMPGQASTTLGTSCLNSAVMALPDFAPSDVGITGCTILERWLRTFVNNAGTMNVDWTLRAFFGDDATDFTRLEREAASAPLGANGVVFHPYLSPTGVVSPFVHPHASGQFFGLREHHRRADLMRAVLEGVAFSIRDCYAAMVTMPREIRLVSGGARNALWCQIIADCLGVPVSVPALEEAGAWGAAMVGAVASGLERSVPAMAARIGERARYVPDARAHADYSAIFGLYRAIAARDADLWTVHANVFGGLRG